MTWEFGQRAVEMIGLFSSMDHASAGLSPMAGDTWDTSTATMSEVLVLTINL